MAKKLTHAENLLIDSLVILLVAADFLCGLLNRNLDRKLSLLGNDDKNFFPRLDILGRSFDFVAVLSFICDA